MGKPQEPTRYEKEKERLYAELQLHDPESAEYQTITKQLKTLSDIECDNSPPKKTVSPDTWVLAGFSLVTTVVVLAYEHAHPIASKAFQFIPKLIK